MTRQEALARAHQLAANAISDALADPAVLDHLPYTDAEDIRTAAEELEANHRRAEQRMTRPVEVLFVSPDAVLRA
ncbi:hypothetical protein [Actinoplanes sp. NPDC051851]|uniref:hypothetical protein n=1 Tax=Actinoplanes sp. NPDC051851 TaxID=3154753 RepID=UPI00342CE104